MWIEVKGRQHRVYWRTNLPSPSPKKMYEKFASRDDARSFIDFAGWVGLSKARAYMADPTPETFATVTAGATSTVTVPMPEPLVRPEAHASEALTAQLLVGVSFSELWSRFLEGQRHNEEGTVELYTGYGKHHLLPFFGEVDLGLIARTRPLRSSLAVPGALYVDDDWVKHMLAKPRLNNVARPIEGTKLSLKFIDNVLVVLAQCFDLAVRERPALLEVNPAKDIRLPKQDRREMHFLEDETTYLALRNSIEEHFWSLLDFLVGTGARYGEAAGLLVKHLHLDAERPHVDIRLALKWRGRKWKLGRPKTRSSVRRVTLPPRLVEVLRPLVEGKGPDSHVFTMVEGGPLHHGNFLNRYFRPAAKRAEGVPSGMRIHDLRHTHAAWLLSDGVPALIVAQRLGHSSTHTTTNVYGHITASADGAMLYTLNRRLPEVLARGDDGAVVLQLMLSEAKLPEFDIDDLDDLAA